MWWFWLDENRCEGSKLHDGRELWIIFIQVISSRYQYLGYSFLTLSPVCCFKCWTNSEDCLNASRQIEHWYKWVSVWINWCSASKVSVLNRLSQWLQANGSSWLCDFRCKIKLLEFTNPFSHISHWNCFLVACDRMWTIKLDDCVNAFEHLQQRYGFSPLWMRRCVLKLPIWVKDFWHMLHW